MLVALLYGLQEVDNSTFANAEIDLSEISLVDLEEADFPRSLFSMNKTNSD